MSRPSLEEMLDDVRFDDLPINWNAFDLSAFSASKSLWDYQQRAVEGAVKALWKYYDQSFDYHPGESESVNRERKRHLFKWYQDNGLVESLDIAVSRTGKIDDLVREYFDVKDERISYDQLINRGCFWMATGSGKTLVLVKLIEILRALIQRKEIPANDILILSCRDDLIEQFKQYVHEFNSSRGDLFIRLRELREYSDAKRNSGSLFKDREITVFYYRSDNLSDEQKERIVDFRNYDDKGKWYVLLDEAHKGDREDSKRQHIYSILSRNGFLFNFSATFTDSRDFTTTIANFNLSEFIKAGYGKHIAILKQEARAFRGDQDYNNEEKQKIVLKSLLMLAYVSRVFEKTRRAAAAVYHRPLLLTLVNSVNTEEADLKLFFTELERIGKGQIAKSVWKEAKAELCEELRQRPQLMFEGDAARMSVDVDALDNLEHKDVLESVYNASSSGELEVLVRPSNKQELAFKLKTSERPFALIKIGDVSGWLKDKLTGYEIVEGFEDDGYFERLNADDSDINILMGSRSFYEGWDSNRPNVINFINIGVGTDARKFILQAVGRGIRIEPQRGKRKRLQPLYNANDIDSELFAKLKEKAATLETLVIFGTNRQVLQRVIEQLEQQARSRNYQQLSLFVNEAATQYELLVPVYKSAAKALFERGDRARFEIEPDELALLRRFVRYVGDDRVLMALFDVDPKQVALLNRSVDTPKEFFKNSTRVYRNIELLVRRLFDYFNIIPKEFETFKQLEDEIRHFKNIKVALTDISDLTEKVETVRGYSDPALIEQELEKKFRKRKISLKQYKEGIKKAARMVKQMRAEYNGKRLKISHVAHHYYLPIILSGEVERVEYIKHIIQTPSEIRFLDQLDAYLELGNNKFSRFDWWLFSKLDESLDSVGIPYYDSSSNKLREFRPDFVFWLQKGRDYFIVFIDPKGTEHTDYQRKLDGFRLMFEASDGSEKVISHAGKRVRVRTFLNTDDIDKVPGLYKKYWFDDIDTALDAISTH